MPQTGGRFSGPEIAGELVQGVSADWQILLPDGTALADLRYTLRTTDGSLLYATGHGLGDVIRSTAPGPGSGG